MFDEILSYGSIPMMLGGILAAGVGVPLPEDGLLLATGVLTHRNAETWWFVLAAAYVAVLCADSLIFGAGYLFGDPILKRRPFRWLITPERRSRVTTIFEKKGAFAVFVGRFATGMRGAIFITAGTERMPYRTFLFWDAMAALITIPVVFGLGYAFHSQLDVVKEILSTAQTGIGIGAVVVMVVGYVLWARRAKAVEEVQAAAAVALADEDRQL
jgi:membrane protein DedA with SNARE-associated domain